MDLDLCATSTPFSLGARSGARASLQQTNLVGRLTAASDSRLYRKANRHGRFPGEICQRSCQTFASVIDRPPTKADLKAYPAKKRWAAEIGGIVISGAQIDTSQDSQAMIANAYAYVVNSGADSVSYKANSGWVDLTAAQIKAIALAVGAHVQVCFSAERTLDEAIDAGTATTLAEIDAAVWPA